MDGYKKVTKDGKRNLHKWKSLVYLDVPLLAKLVARRDRTANWEQTAKTRVILGGLHVVQVHAKAAKPPVDT